MIAVAMKRTEPPGWVSAIMKAVGRTLSPHLGRITELEKRISELENRRELSYQGTWKPDTRALPGQFFTRNGSVWHCKGLTTSAPGTDPQAWQLAVKKGRDSRDLKGGSSDD